MEKTQKIKIFLVDDDALFLKSLEIDFQIQDDFEIETFSTGELCIANLFKKPQVIILDFYLNGIDKNAINGLDTLDNIKKYDSKIPVIMLSSQDKIDIAVKCMHHNAFDYVVKSETAFIRLQKNILTILNNQKIENELNWYMDMM